EVRRWVDGSGFRAEPGGALRLTDGTILFGIDDKPTLWSFAAAPAALSPGDYFFVDLPLHVHGQVALGWGLGCYRFDRYKTPNESRDKSLRRLSWPDGADRVRVTREIRAIELVRDLINTPACDLGPD